MTFLPHRPESRRHPRASRHAKTSWRAFAALAAALGLGAQARASGTLFDHHTFADFSRGTFSDSGANLYVSRDGHIQFINLWDLNADGYPEVIVNNDHNHHSTPDVLVYHNRSPQGLRSLFHPMHEDASAYDNLTWTLASLSSVTRLPAEGGGKAILTDLTGSGYQDLLLTNFVHGSTLNDFPVYLYWGGPEGFSVNRRTVLPVYRGTGIAVGDLSGSGLKDIVVSDAGREHMEELTGSYAHDDLEKIAGPEEKRSYLFHQAEGGFKPEGREIIPTLFAIDVKMAELDQSGEKSLVFLELGKPGALRILRRKNGKWAAPEFLPVLNPVWGWPDDNTPPCTRQILVKDLNGDGYPDIFVPSEGPSSEIFWNDHGAFSVKNRTVLPTENALAAEAADLNHDGHVDLVIANYFSKDSSGMAHYETNSYIWWGSAQGFSADRRTALPTQGATSVCLADVNGTGRQDILISQHRNQGSFDVPSYIYFNAPGGFSPGNRMDLQGFGGVSIVAADLEKSGRTDVVLVNRQSGAVLPPDGTVGAGSQAGDDPGQVPMYIYRGNPDGKYGPGNLIRVPESRYQTLPAFADMEDSGRPALVYLPKEGTSLVIRYDIYNYPSSREFTEIKLPFEGKSVCVADFNHDGILDCLVLPHGAVYNLGEKKGQGALVLGLGGRKYRVELFDFGGQAFDCVVGDINNDGLLDAVTCGFREINILRGSNQGGFHFEKPVVMATDMSVGSVSLADFSGHGWLDILSQNFENMTTKDNATESWVLINDHGEFSFDRKRTFHTYGALSGSVAQIWGDGTPAFINANYLNGRSRRAPTILFHADKDGYPTDQGKVRLPAYSSSGNYALDFTGSGYLDILAFNHTGQSEYNGDLEPKGGTHSVGSFLYRGGPGGYDKEAVTWIPSFGPHYRTTAEPGSISRRDPFEVYTSPVLVNTTKREQFILTVSGRFNRRQYVEPAILVVDHAAGTERPAELTRLAQSADSATFRVVLPPGATFKYRLKLMSSHSGGGPVVTGVRLATDDDRGR